jgi:hypothetical protein
LRQPVNSVEASRRVSGFDCAPWVHKAIELPKEEFKREVEKQLTGQETEPWEILYFKVYGSQLPVIEQALETAELMLGNEKSRGYCLEMVCADFLAGASLESGEVKSRLGLEVRQITPRTKLDDDVEENVITLCWECHRRIDSK